jgi:hypothetical protein
MNSSLEDWTEDDWRVFHIAKRTYETLLRRPHSGFWPDAPRATGNVWAGGALGMRAWLALGRQIENLPPPERFRSVELWRELNGMERLQPLAYYKTRLHEDGFKALSRAKSAVTKEQMLRVKCPLCGAKVDQMCFSTRIAADGSPVEINRCHVHERAEAYLKKAIASGEMERGGIEFPRLPKARKA